MKKIISFITVCMLFTLLIFTGSSFAVKLDTINVNTDKTIVRPGEEVKVTIEFGKDLGAYTFDVAYDNNIFDYVSVEGGTPNATADKVRVAYHDATGGSNPRTNMSVVFKAKADITTSNPTDFTVTGEGLANADASEVYDDITVGIVKNVTVEPQYVDYTFKLEYTGDILKEQEKEMTLSYSSPMGHYYEHARLVAEATMPSGANIKLVGTDSANLEHDVIQSGWGDAQGYKIGGKDVSQVLHLRGTFSEVGDYAIKFKLIDRDNSDAVISEKTFNIKVADEKQEETTNPVPDTENTENNEKVEEVKKEETPKKLPKTGYNIYGIIPVILIVLVGSYAYYNKRK